jgi:tetratricopeptide (TPR) repeat protein
VSLSFLIVKIVNKFVSLRKKMSNFNIRNLLSELYIGGSGIEIGALHRPLPVYQDVRVKYVDFLPVADLKNNYPELGNNYLMVPDIIDDGAVLSTVRNESQDFVIANHFLEHCENPINALKNMLRVLKKGGILYLALPDKRFTFDKDRELTPFEHIMEEFHQGTEHTRKEHYKDWVVNVKKISGTEKIEEKIKKLIDTKYSIHFHVWTQIEIMELFISLKKKFDFNIEIEAFIKNGEEFISIIRKTESDYDPALADKLFNEGMEQFLNNDFADAETTFTKLCQINEYNAEYLFYLGSSCFKQEKYEQAIDALAESLELDPSRKDTYIYLASCLEKTGDPETAKLYYDKSEEI